MKAKFIFTAIVFGCVIAFAPLAMPGPIVAQTQKRLSLAQDKRLRTLIDQHQRVRARLPAEYRNTLDRLTALARKNLVARISNTDVFDATSAFVHKHIPEFTNEELRTMTDYVLGGIAAGDPIGAAAGGSSQDDLLNATKQMQETQMSFNLQYLQLQSQMQNENRSYTAISNIMKTKHDTVKNSINNVR